MTAEASSTTADVTRALRVLHEPGAVFELRMPKVGRYRDTAAGYFDDADAAARAVLAYDGKRNIFVTINPCTPALLARYQNRIAERADRGTTTDADSAGRRWLFLDIDARRPAEVSSTEEELIAAANLGTTVQEVLSLEGWPAPVSALSGNGYYLLYRVDLPNDTASLVLVKGVLEALAKRFDTPEAHIDTSVHNAGRIIGLVGTLKMKGDNTRERPHRRSRLVEVPDVLDVVTEAQLRALLQEEEPKRESSSRQYSQTTPSLQEMLDQVGADYRDSGPDAAGVQRFNLAICPFCEGESGGYRCGVGQAPSGAYSGHCFSYPDKHWQDFRKALGLDRFFSRQQKQQGSAGNRNGASPDRKVIAEDQQPAGPVLRLLSEVMREDVSWRWKDRLPRGKLVVISGDPGAGKSWLTLALTTAETTGAALPGDTARQEPRRVLLLTAEDGLADTVVPRLEAMGAHLNLVTVMEAVRDAEGRERWPSIGENIFEIESVLATGAYGLVVIDPVNAYLRGVDGHRDIDIRSVLGPLAQLADRYGVAIVIVRHLTKSTSDKALYRGAGGIGYVGQARVELLVGYNPNETSERVVVVNKNNLAAAAPAVAFEIKDGLFLWKGEVDVSADDLLGADGKPAESHPRQEAADFLREALADGEVESQALLREAGSLGLSRTTIFRAKKELVIKARREGVPGQRGKGKWYWSLPEGLRVSRVSIDGSETLNPSQTRNSASDTQVDTLNPCPVCHEPLLLGFGHPQCRPGPKALPSESLNLACAVTDCGAPAGERDFFGEFAAVPEERVCDHHGRRHVSSPDPSCHLCNGTLLTLDDDGWLSEPEATT